MMEWPTDRYPELELWGLRSNICNHRALSAIFIVKGRSVTRALWGFWRRRIAGCERRKKVPQRSARKCASLEEIWRVTTTNTLELSSLEHWFTALVCHSPPQLPQFNQLQYLTPHGIRCLGDSTGSPRMGVINARSGVSRWVAEEAVPEQILTVPVWRDTPQV
jgi:hypothetical protein